MQKLEFFHGFYSSHGIGAGSDYDSPLIGLEVGAVPWIDTVLLLISDTQPLEKTGGIFHIFGEIFSPCNGNRIKYFCADGFYGIFCNIK